MKSYFFIFSLLLAASAVFAQAQPAPNSGLTRVEMTKDVPTQPVEEKHIIRKFINARTGEVTLREVVTQKELDARKAAADAEKAKNTKRDRKME
jgi:hypothetical protein